MPAPKKILIVITKGDMGGAQVFVHELARGLKAAGLDVTVGMGEGEFLRNKLAPEGIPVVTFEHLKRGVNPLAALRFALELKRFLRKNPFDVVQFNSSNSLAGAWGVKRADRNIRTVFTVHGLSILDRHYEASAPMRSAYRLFFRFFLRFVDAPVFVDRHDLDEARRGGLVADGAVIYNGFDADSLRLVPRTLARITLAAKIDRELGDALIIGSIGRLSYQKNYQFLIRSFPEVLKIRPDAIGIVIGDGPTRDECEALIRELGLENSFFLAGEMSDAAQYLQAFDLFLLPSRYEGLPVTLTECLFVHVPVLVSDVGANNELTGEQSRYRLDDQNDLLEKFTAGMENLQLLLCDESKKPLFAIGAMIERYTAVFSGNDLPRIP